MLGPQSTLAAIAHAYSRDPFVPVPDEENMGGKMKVARIVIALVATVVAALAVVGTAAADPPGMTYNSSVPGMTYNDMTYN